MHRLYEFIGVIVCCLNLKVVSSISTGSTIIYRFRCGFICGSLCQSIKIKSTHMCIAVLGCTSKLTHTGVEIDICVFQTDCQFSSAASGIWLGLCFWHNFSGMNRTCWTTGSWRGCLSLAVMSSIPAGSTIIHRLLCGFICVSLWQSINIKPTKICNDYDNWGPRVINWGPLCWNKSYALNNHMVHTYLWYRYYLNTLVCCTLFSSLERIFCCHSI